MQITTTNGLPIMSTSHPENVETTSVHIAGSVYDIKESDIISFGFCWSTSQNPTINEFHKELSGSYESFQTDITGLTPNTMYYICSYATSGFGTGYGPYFSFITLPEIDQQVIQLVDIQGGII